jgi:hypothetical protein
LSFNVACGSAPFAVVVDGSVWALVSVAHLREEPAVFVAYFGLV